MSATSFGGSFKLVASGDTKLKNIFLDRLKRAAIDSQFPFLKYIPFTPPSMSEDFNAMIDRIIAARRDEMKGKSSGKKDLLQMFIETHDADPIAFSELHMREEMALFMVAGSDTSSTTLTFTLLLLVEHIEKLEKLRKEVDEAFPDKNGEITFAGTQDLVYLNAVINESMRVLPIVTVGMLDLSSLCSLSKRFMLIGTL
jgi:cytochrome P450